MATDPTQTSKRRFLYTIDVLIEDETNGRALEKLLRLLNNKEITDYQIQSGIELGALIQEALSEPVRKLPLEHLPVGKRTEEPEHTTPPANDANRAIWEQFQQFKSNNALVRMTIVKPMGVRLSVPCRILNVDQASGNVSVYHVDEKQVYLFKFNEIDDFSAS